MPEPGANKSLGRRIIATLGFGRPTGLGIPGESQGQVRAQLAESCGAAARFADAFFVGRNVHVFQQHAAVGNVAGGME